MEGTTMEGVPTLNHLRLPNSPRPSPLKGGPSLIIKPHHHPPIKHKYKILL